MSERLVAPVRVDEDVQFDVGLRPRALDEYIGQDRIRDNLHVAIAAARQRGEALDQVLLYGPPGLGKTTLAYQWTARGGRRAAWYVVRSAAADVAHLCKGVALAAAEMRLSVGSMMLPDWLVRRP